MKREILFRGLCVEEVHTHHEQTEPGEWLEGYLVNPHTIRIKMSGECGGIGSGIVSVDVGVDPKTVGQYTGVKINGQKLFEGDIVGHFDLDYNSDDDKPVLKKAYPCIYGIDSDYPAFTLKGYELTVNNIQHIVLDVDTCDGEYFKIIGNIHDNPELL